MIPTLKRWTAADDEQLRTLYATHSGKALSALLDRSASSIYVRAHQLRLTKPRLAEDAPKRDKASAPGRKGWTKADDALLGKQYATVAVMDLARVLRRTVAATYARATQLGLRKPPEQAAAHLASVRAKAHQARGAMIWTKQAIALLRKIYPVTPGHELSARLGCRVSQIYAMATKLGLKKDPALKREMARQALLDPAHPARATRFQKGHAPANKGVKGWQAGGRAKDTQFKTGHRPHTFRPLGSIRINDGFLYVKVADEGYTPRDWQLLHRMVWELHHGPIAPGHVLRFKDGNHMHVGIDNLELLTKAENCVRNSVHNFPKELVQVIQLRGAIKRQINKRERNHEQQDR